MTLFNEMSWLNYHGNELQFLCFYEISTLSRLKLLNKYDTKGNLCIIDRTPVCLLKWMYNQKFIAPKNIIKYQYF